MKISMSSDYCKVKTGKYVQGVPDGQFTALDISLAPPHTNQLFILPWRIAQVQILPQQIERKYEVSNGAVSKKVQKLTVSWPSGKKEALW